MEEILEKIVIEDKDFTEAKFKTKVDNMYIQTFTAVMKQDLIRVKHFLSEKLYSKFEKKVEELQNRNLIQIYGELNVSDTNIIKASENDNEFEIEVKLLTKYLDYKIDKNTKKMVSGNSEVRTEEYKRLILTKTKNAKSLGVARTCQSCGANMDLNLNGRCPYCGTVFELQNYDWIIKDIV